MPLTVEASNFSQEILEFASSFLSLLTEYYQGSMLLLVIIGWVFIPVFTHRLARQREKSSLINKNIENIESIFEEMNQLATEQYKLKLQDNTLYFKLILCHQKLIIYCNRMEKIEPSFEFPKKQVSDIRQFTTNDKVIEEYGVSTMHRLLYAQMELIKKYPQRC